MSPEPAGRAGASARAAWAAWIGAAASRAAPLALSLALVAGLCAVLGASPAAVAASLWEGAFGSMEQAARVLATLAPLLLCGSGLLFTFRAGLYHLGVEGQLVIGAVCATGAARAPWPGLAAGAAVALCIAAGALGGALWGALTGALHTRGRVSEIFAGLGMNFVAQGAVLYLVFGPWKRPGVASMAGTEPLDSALWLSTLGGTELSPAALLLAALALVGTAVVLGRTHFGLRLRAVGLSPRAAEVLGVPAAREMLLAFAISGALAGVAGAVQVLGTFHRLIPSVSSNLGFLALLVVMLAGRRAALVAPIALFFSALNVGSLKLPMTLGLESSLSGVLQGVLVLLALLSPWKARGGARPEEA
ncbi:ABC transporter permease [Sorangium sp. So ce1389]|uniref:ABC transporter permease n=1 Tax=Sorangium sp. So ce1389 TaxID=3133336 RepID=UPI003F61935A